MSPVLPDHVLRLMSPEDRAKLGKAGQTAAEAREKFDARLERTMHDEFERWLGLHRDKLYWDHSRMDRATSNRVGHPDFVIQRAGRVLNIEFKVLGAPIRTKQIEVHEWIARTGGCVHVCYATEEAIKVTRETFWP